MFETDKSPRSSSLSASNSGVVSAVTNGDKMFLAWARDCPGDFPALRELVSREDLQVEELLEREEVVSAAKAGHEEVLTL